MKTKKVMLKELDVCLIEFESRIKNGDVQIQDYLPKEYGLGENSNIKGLKIAANVSWWTLYFGGEGSFFYLTEECKYIEQGYRHEQRKSNYFAHHEITKKQFLDSIKCIKYSKNQFYKSKAEFPVVLSDLEKRLGKLSIKIETN